MNVLVLGLDPSVIHAQSATARRAARYGELVDSYSVITLGERVVAKQLADNVTVYSIKRLGRITTLLAFYLRARSVIKHEHVHVISVQDTYYLALLGWWLSRRLKVGLEIQVHGFEKFSGLRTRIARFVLPRAHSVRTVSERLMRQLTDEFSVVEDVITVAPVPTDVSGLQARRSYQAPANKRFVFLSVGRLVPVKRIELQIEALAELIAAGERVELWIVGDGPQREMLQMLVAERQLARFVHFWGARSDVADFYERANAFLLTSDSEGWGMVAVEAAASGLPIIMTDVGLAGEVIISNESGLVIQPGEQEALTSAMHELLHDAGLRERLGVGAQQAVKQLPDQRQINQLYVRSWERAAKRGHG